MRWPTLAVRRMRLLALAGCLLGAACAAPRVVEGPPAEPPARAIHLVSHGWHTGIAIARADLPEGFPALADFPHADVLEFGWGDAEFYPAAEPSLWQGLRALLWPTPSVLHVAALRGDLAATFPTSTIVRLEISEAGLGRLLEFIRAEFQRDIHGRPVSVAPGLYGASRFYRGQRSFHFPHTCNWWTAQGLLAAGIPVEPALALTAHGLLRQAIRHGEQVRRP